VIRHFQEGISTRSIAVTCRGGGGGGGGGKGEGEGEEEEG
jgi:hypothetical protein